jgi:hypothetical protein
VNILDENILESQRRLLRDWRVSVRQIGHDIGRKGLKDREIITLLQQQRRVTFFTLDADFYQPSLCHAKYCLVCLEVRKHEAALFIRRILRHPNFNTVAKRLGKIVRISSAKIAMWPLHADKEQSLPLLIGFKEVEVR